MTNKKLPGLGFLGLCVCACVVPTPDGGSSDAGDRAATSNGVDSGIGGGADSGSNGGEADAELDSRADSSAEDALDAASSARSCRPGGNGLSNCGASSESCCTSLEVTGGSYSRTYANSGVGPTAEADPANVSGFRLDKYEVTVGRFRQFAKAWGSGSGYLPPAGSGKHTHLNGGQGLANSADDAGSTFETGWVSSDDAYVAPTSANLACKSKFATWTASAGGSETLPINCVNWYEAVAFCIWDGGFLPSEAEWEYAAAGGSQERAYPWGATPPGTGNEYAIYGCYYPFGDAGSCTGGAAPVGTARGGAGLWNQVDLAGNVHEWSLDGYAAYRDQCADCAYLTARSSRVIRGGYFYNFAPYLVPTSRGDDSPTVRSICIGFRCARTP
jgi:formylglycine-generating enzyme required for sulfatase activity